MTQAISAFTRDSVPCPTPADIESMMDASDAVDPRPAPETASKRLDKPVHGNDRAYATDLLDRLCRLAPLGGECRELALDYLVGELRLARSFGEIDGEMIGNRQADERHRRSYANLMTRLEAA